MKKLFIVLFLMTSIMSNGQQRVHQTAGHD